MRLAWTAIVPRSLVDRADATTLAPGRGQLLAVVPHRDPRFAVVRCYRHARRVEPSPAA
jgi:hypothetical protein